MLPVNNKMTTGNFFKVIHRFLVKSVGNGEEGFGMMHDIDERDFLFGVGYPAFAAIGDF